MSLLIRHHTIASRMQSANWPSFNRQEALVLNPCNRCNALLLTQRKLQGW